MPLDIDTHTLALFLAERREVDLNSLSPADWTRLASRARAEGVAPMLYWTLSKSGFIASLPADAQNSLRAAYSVTWLHNRQLFVELEGLARLFQQEGIPLAAVKGACFALTLYPDIGLRPMGDLDLLVPAKQFKASIQTAQSAGYEDVGVEAAPGLRDLISNQVLLQKRGAQPLNIEIHNNLIASSAYVFSAPVDWFWEQTEALVPPSAPFRPPGLLMLTPTAQTLHAAAHAMLQHGGRNAPLRWLYDLHLLLTVYSARMDWDLLLTQAAKFEWGSALDAALSETVSHFGSPIPDSVRERSSAHSDRHKNLVARKQQPAPTHILLEKDALASLKWHGRIRLFLALIAPSPAYMRRRYRIGRSWAIPAYYLYRWWVILQDALRTLWALLKDRM